MRSVPTTVRLPQETIKRLREAFGDEYTLGNGIRHVLASYLSVRESDTVEKAIERLRFDIELLERCLRK